MLLYFGENELRDDKYVNRGTAENWAFLFWSSEEVGIHFPYAFHQSALI